MELYNNCLFSCYKTAEWAAKASAEIEKNVGIVLQSQDECSIMLTGGNSTKLIYDHWKANPIKNFSRLRFYFGDERCVEPEHTESNYGLAKRTFFFTQERLEKVHWMYEGEMNSELAANNYEDILPNQIDLLFLGLGTDGHIASIFPHSGLTHRSNRKVLSSNSPVWPNERITVTSDVILDAKFVFLFAIGAEKGKVLAKAMQEPDKTEEMPVRMTIGRHWLIDETACTEFKHIIGIS
jgi:6-phosphogluconolactonase